MMGRPNMAEKWSAKRVQEIHEGYRSACVLFAAAELDLFAAVAAEPLSAEQLAGRLATDIRATTILADALAAMDLLVKTGGQYRLADGVADLLTDCGAAAMFRTVRLNAACMRRWCQLSDIVRAGEPVEAWPKRVEQEDGREDFIGAMNEIHRGVAPQLIADLDLPAFGHLLDVGGASGTWTLAFLRAAPDARATLFDLPDVIPLARRRITDEGLIDRVRLVGGDFQTDDLPGGADLAWVSAIIHQNSPEENRRLYAKIHAALADGGRILIRDIVMDESRTRPAAGAMFAINMLTATRGGSTYTFGEIRDDLLSVGFSQPALLHESPFMDSVVGAVKS
jgi:precorrin-6B methylase 2